MSKRRRKARGREAASELATPADIARSFYAAGPYGDPGFFGSTTASAVQDFTSPLKQNPWLAAAARSLARNIGGVRARVFKGKRLQPKTWVAVQDEHPLQRLIDSPNPWMTRSRFWRLHIAYFLEQGENVHVLSNAGGMPRTSLADTPTMIFPANPARLTLLYGANKTPAAWRFDDGTVIPTAAVMHPYEPDHSGNVFRGLSPLVSAWVDLRADYLAGRMSESFFDNYASLGGILKSKKRLTDATATQKLERWNAMHAGAHKAERTAILDEDTEWQPNNRTQKDMEFIELRKWSIAVVSAITGVPKKELAILEDVNNATAISSDRQYWKSTLVPMIFELEETFWAELFQWIEGGQYFVSWELSSVPALREDEKEKSEIALRYQLMGVRFEDINAKLGLNFKPQGDLDNLQLLPQNLIPIEMAVPQDDAAAIASDGTSAQDQALNGAQIASLVELVEKVKSGAIPAASATQLVMLAVPGISAAAAQQLVGPAAANVTPTPTLPVAPKPAAQLAAPTGGARPGKGDDAEAEQQAAGRSARGRLDRARAVRIERARAVTAKTRARFARFEQTVLRPNRARYRAKVKGFFFEQKRDMLDRLDRIIGARLDRGAPAIATLWARGQRREALDTLDAIARRALAEFLRASLDPGAIERIFEDRQKWDDNLKRLTKPIAAATLDATGAVLTEELGAEFTVSATDPRWTTFLERQGAALVRNVNDETIAWTRESILRDIRAGKDPQEIRDALKAHPAFSTARANRIAITEVGNAASTARYETYSDVPNLRHQWLTNGGSSVRESHKAIDGEVRNVGEPFGNSLLFPHDPAGPAEEVVECHCSAVSVIE